MHFAASSKRADNSVGCVICEFVLREVDSLLKQNASEVSRIFSNYKMGKIMHTVKPVHVVTSIKDHLRQPHSLGYFNQNTANFCS